MTAPVIVGVDGSAGSAAALRWAAEAAAMRGTRLVIVHAISADASPIHEPEIVDTAALLDEAARTACDVAALDEVETLIRDEPILDCLLSLSRNAALIVVGAMKMHAVSPPESLAKRLASRAASPVVVVPAGFHTTATLDGRPPHVAAGVLPAAPERHVLGYAADEAALRHVTLKVIACAGATPVSSEGGGVSKPLPTVARQLLAEVAATHPSLQIDLSVTAEAPDTVLLAAGREASLLVVGNSHAARTSSATTGPITSALLDALPCPVAVIGPHNPAMVRFWDSVASRVSKPNALD